MGYEERRWRRWKNSFLGGGEVGDSGGVSRAGVGYKYLLSLEKLPKSN